MKQIKHFRVSWFLLMFTVSLLLPLAALAQREKKVDAEYLYMVPGNTTLEMAKRTALERAQIQAIGDEFGTIVSQSNVSVMSNQNGNSNIDFFSLGSSDVKGEWIETIGEPEYSQGFDGDQMWVRCKVRGRIREIVSAQIDLVAKVLRNGTEEKFEGYDFKSGDDMFLYFQSPANGYLAVYLVDETAQTAYCLLPYSQSDDASQKIKHDTPYVFFSPKHAPKELQHLVDELNLTCADGIERNDLYVIFSPKVFAKANSSQKDELLPRQLSWKDFNEWLAKSRKRDNDMYVEKKPIIISK